MTIRKKEIKLPSYLATAMKKKWTRTDSHDKMIRHAQTPNSIMKRAYAMGEGGRFDRGIPKMIDGLTFPGVAVDTDLIPTTWLVTDEDGRSEEWVRSLKDENSDKRGNSVRGIPEYLLPDVLKRAEAANKKAARYGVEPIQVFLTGRGLEYTPTWTDAQTKKTVPIPGERVFEVVMVGGMPRLRGNWELLATLEHGAGKDGKNMVFSAEGARVFEAYV